MSRNSPAGKFKYLPLIAFLLFISVSGNSNNPGSTEKTQAKDTAKLKVTPDSTDTVKTQVIDTVNLKGTDSLSVPRPDSLNAPIQDSLSQQLPDSVVFKQKTFSHEELIRGERLFMGLAYLVKKSVNCAACHNTHVSDTLNWNPDALEISKKYLNKSANDLSKVLLKPTGKNMKLVHTGFELTAKDIVLMKAYMDQFVTKGLIPVKPVITYLLLLIIASILFLLATTDLIIKKIFKNQRLNWVILTITGIFITWILAVNAIAFGRSNGYAPAQPIKFSHAVHAGQNKTDCNYCHYSAKTGKTAGIPAGSVCLNCHLLVRNGTRSGTAEIAKVIEAFETKKAVEWVRIYKLPDFVFFSHEQHVSAGQIDCETCHGNVKLIDRLFQEPDLSMGWCIDCHKTRKVNMSNEYYKTYYPGFYDSLQAGKIDSVMVIGIGGRDCGKCHY